MIVSCGRLSNENQRRINEKQQIEIDSLYSLLNSRDTIVVEKDKRSETKKYYIVIGSFSNIENAHDMQANTMLNTKILYIKDYYRVIADSANSIATLSKKYENVKNTYTEEIITIRDD